MILIENISKSFGKRLALDSIDLSVKDNELFGLIGPDGSGKTTLFRILCSLLLPDSGKALLNNHDVVKDYNKIRRIIGYMPGRFSLYNDLSVEENLNFFARVFGTSIKKNYGLIKDIYKRLEPFKDRRAGNLSGGMKQKLALSCALIHRPEILILDEPTTGVDAVSRKEFWEMLSGIIEQGITIMVSTPYMDEAVLCNRVALMQEGRLLRVDSPQAIIDAYPKDIIALRADDMYRLVMDLRDFPQADSVLLFGQEVHYSGKGKNIDRDAIRKYLEDKEHKDIQINTISAGIEDSFLQLMA